MSDMGGLVRCVAGVVLRGHLQQAIAHLGRQLDGFDQTCRSSRVMALPRVSSFSFS